MQRIQNLINGELAAPVGGSYLDSHNPATGEVYSQVPDSGAADVEAAVAAAEAAFGGWSTLPAAKRASYMERLASLLEKNLDAFAAYESNDNGKPLWLSKTVDIPRAISNLRFFAGAIQHFASESHAMTDLAINYTLRQPIGVVGCISPWNLPLYLFTWKFAPALAAGNCLVAKPSEVTPMTAFRLSELVIEAGLPPGVLNIVHGSGAKTGAAITAHPRVPCISFTGGTTTGAQIASVAAPMFKKLSLELGGKNPNIIFADCRYQEMLETTVRSSFANQGQICLCGSRILVERDIYEQFKTDLVARATALVVGDPLLEETQQGAVVSAGHQHKILACIEQAKAEGGRVLCGGHAVTVPGRCQGGYFVAPTVIEGLGADCRTNQEEIFGPVVTIMPFDNEDQALEIANATPYGLAATVWTENLSRAHRLASTLKSGIVWINCWLIRDLRTPFGGMKQSGVGREGGFEALRFFTEPRNVCIKIK